MRYPLKIASGSMNFLRIILSIFVIHCIIISTCVRYTYNKLMNKLIVKTFCLWFVKFEYPMYAQHLKNIYTAWERKKKIWKRKREKQWLYWLWEYRVQGALYRLATENGENKFTVSCTFLLSLPQCPPHLRLVSLSLLMNYESSLLFGPSSIHTSDIAVCAVAHARVSITSFSIHNVPSFSCSASRCISCGFTLLKLRMRWQIETDRKPRVAVFHVALSCTKSSVSPVR